jgi:biotin transport system substrate-specific component
MHSLRLSVFSALFTALMVVGAYLKIPLGPVPIVLANFFVILAGVVLGAKWAAASVGLYLLLGAFGLPVFAGGGGLAYLAGPTGGFLLGYLPSAVIAGVISHRGKSHPAKDAIGLIAGALAIYFIGVPWLKYSLDMSWAESLTIGMFPFLIGDGIKTAGALAVNRMLQNRLPELFTSLAEEDPAP